MSDVVIMNIPIRNNGMTEATDIEIAIVVSGTIESAGYRATLFGRLIDEHQQIRNG